MWKEMEAKTGCHRNAIAAAYDVGDDEDDAGDDNDDAADASSRIISVD